MLFNTLIYIFWLINIFANTNLTMRIRSNETCVYWYWFWIYLLLVVTFISYNQTVIELSDQPPWQIWCEVILLWVKNKKRLLQDRYKKVWHSKYLLLGVLGRQTMDLAQLYRHTDRETQCCFAFIYIYITTVYGCHDLTWWVCGRSNAI